MVTSELRRSLIVLGAFLIMFTLGSNYTFGNMMVYIVSYMRKRSNCPDLKYAEFIEVAAVFGITQGFIMCLSGFIVQFTGHKPCILLGALIYSSHAFMSIYSINGSLWQMAFTYGFLPSLGHNLAYLSTITLAMKCFPDKRATISGIVTAGLGIGGFVFNELQTLYLNPNNLSPTELLNENKADSLSRTHILFKENYFDQPEILDRVPGILKLLGTAYTVLLCVGIALIWWGSFSFGRSVQDSSYIDDDCEETQLLGPEESSRSRCKRNVYFVINQVEFRSLWLTRFFIIIINNTFISFYKAFGQTFIMNDLLISTTGSIGGIANFFGRFIFGWLMDKSSYKNIMIVSTTVLTLLLASFYYTKDSGYMAYGVALCSIMFSLPSTFSTQPAIAQERYGPNLGQLMMGLVATGDIINNFLVGSISGYILENLGWGGLYATLTFVGFGSLISVLIFPSSNFS